SIAEVYCEAGIRPADQIHPMINIEVAQVDGGSTWAGRKAQSRLESPISISHQHRYAIAIGHGQILNRVAIEVTHDNRIWRSADREVDRRLERPVAVAHQQRDIVGTGVSHGQI